MHFPSDPAFVADIFLPLKIGLGILLGYLLLDWFHNRYPPEDPDGWV